MYKSCIFYTYDNTSCIFKWCIAVVNGSYTLQSNIVTFSVLYSPLRPPFLPLTACSTSRFIINTLRLRQHCCHFAYRIFKCIFLNENVWILVKISLKFVQKVPINNIPALVQMAWYQPGNKPLSSDDKWYLVCWHIYASLYLLLCCTEYCVILDIVIVWTNSKVNIVKINGINNIWGVIVS